MFERQDEFKTEIVLTNFRLSFRAEHIYFDCRTNLLHIKACLAVDTEYNFCSFILVSIFQRKLLGSGGTLVRIKERTNWQTVIDLQWLPLATQQIQPKKVKHQVQKR